jgi:reverse gyrase
MRTLIIVESPAKARTLGNYLSKDYTVRASVGHIRDLPSHEMGVDVDNDCCPARTHTFSLWVQHCRYQPSKHHSLFVPPMRGLCNRSKSAQAPFS